MTNTVNSNTRTVPSIEEQRKMDFDRSFRDTPLKQPPAPAPKFVTPPSPSTLLDNRAKTHGSFTDHARITQRLKAVLLDEYEARLKRGDEPLNNAQREALEMIVHKIGRVVAGNAHFDDHWDDISGYALLCTSAQGHK